MNGVGSTISVKTPSPITIGSVEPAALVLYVPPRYSVVVSSITTWSEVTVTMTTVVAIVSAVFAAVPGPPKFASAFELMFAKVGVADAKPSAVNEDCVPHCITPSVFVTGAAVTIFRVEYIKKAAGDCTVTPPVVTAVTSVAISVDSWSIEDDAPLRKNSKGFLPTSYASSYVVLTRYVLVTMFETVPFTNGVT
jgi:hypothetical protein